jgi:6-phosphogluconolactonase (cycloisomerase 2 family)
MFTRSPHKSSIRGRLLLAALFCFTSVSLLPAKERGPVDDRWRDEGGGAVFALTNSPGGNAVVAYRRASNGSLQPAGTFPTGGVGTGAGLGSQGAVVVTDDRRFVLAANAGSNSITVFRIRNDRLDLIDVEPSRGAMPTSVAVRNGLVVVLNAGEPNSLAGFRLGPQGRLTPIPGFTGVLSGPQASPAQVGFSEDGDTIVVTERATNLIATFPVDSEELGAPTFTPSAGPTPFGFAVGARNTLLVSEAGAGGGASTYRLGRNGLNAVSSALMTGQRAACWALLTPDGRFGYVSNAGTGTITGFAIARDGSATLRDADGVSASTGGNPTDMAITQDGRYLYARVANLTSIAVFRIERDGSLTTLPSLTGTPTGLAGLAGF